MEVGLDFSRYGKSFQESLAQIILEDRPFADQIQEVLDINFYELKYLRSFIKIIYDYRDKYRVHPTKQIMQTILRTGLDNENEATRKQVRDFFARICITELTDSNYIKETSLDFCKKQKLKEALIKSVDLIKQSSYDEVKNLIDTALKLGTDNDFGHDFKKDFEARYLLKARNPISTGWDEIDEVCKNGLGKGELGVVIAPTGAGKSMVLVHLGATAIKQGKNVVHYTLELSEESTGQRYDSCISGIALQNLPKHKEKIYEDCMDVPGELIIKEYPTKSIGVNALRANLEKIKKRNEKVDMILVDYGDLLKPSTIFRERRDELQSIYEDLRSLAQEFECPVWTASQTNRSGLNAEVITMESISEAFSKCFVADFIFSISRTIKDKASNMGRLFLAKNRNGPDGIIFPIFMDTSRVDIRVLKTTGETMDDIAINAVKVQRDELKKKYEKFKMRMENKKK